MVKIKEIPINDRPMERLIQNGVDILSNEELIAIILKTGTRGNSAKELSSLLLSKIGGIKKLNNTKADYLHIDTMDGIFVPNTQMPIEEIIELERVSTKP